MFFKSSKKSILSLLKKSILLIVKFCAISAWFTNLNFIWVFGYNLKFICKNDKFYWK